MLTRRDFLKMSLAGGAATFLATRARFMRRAFAAQRSSPLFFLYLMITHTAPFMIKALMRCYDVLFPINLGPLTYVCPEALAETVQPGLLVQALLKNKLTKGIILDKNLSPPEGPLKEIMAIPGEPVVLSRSLLRLLRWMSDYYISPEGLVLKQNPHRGIIHKNAAAEKQKRTFRPGRNSCLWISGQKKFWISRQ